VTGLTVVKLGGSQIGSKALAGWIAAIKAARGRIVVVPGGGPFADTVRAMQPVLGYDDDAAHDMALMAMAQFGRALCGAAGFVYVETPIEIRDCAAAGGIACFAPWPTLRDALEMARSWDVTSDSIAAWLARRLAASRLVLIKAKPAPSSDVKALVTGGYVDRAFARYAREFGGECIACGPEDAEAGFDAGVTLSAA
jgi:aspartokinase-like uncharacterized kinase